VVKGRHAEFTVWVGDALVVKKVLPLLFPRRAKIVEAVRGALGEA
jgi:hypothetical protein